MVPRVPSRVRCLHTYPQATFRNRNYVGKAVVLRSTGHTAKALDTLARLFQHAKMQDIRSRDVFDGARRLFYNLQVELADQNVDEAMACVDDYRAAIEILSGYPIRVEAADFEDVEDKVRARTQIAWQHQCDHHLLSTRRGLDRKIVSHVQAHELTHLKMESEARSAGRNRFFYSTAKAREKAILSIDADILRWRKHRYSEASITKLTLLLISRICSYVFNCPIDMLIERDIRSRFPVLRASQYLSLHRMFEDVWRTNRTSVEQKLTPRKILQPTLALSGCYALFLDDLLDGAADFAEPYRNMESFRLSQRLYQCWVDHSQNLKPGDEYALVDRFAQMLGLRGWYDWQPDPGQDGEQRS